MRGQYFRKYYRAYSVLVIAGTIAAPTVTIIADYLGFLKVKQERLISVSQ